VLQILFNLLENALQACVEGRQMDRTVTLRLRLPGAGRVQIQVLDNGIGIASDHLSQIFSQGFSTRATGHGFGLHSSVLAAQEMGGTLNVQSDGPGKGACFTLEIPVSSENG
jgi:signal transduction histidine kinase